ncbi:MAG TPA: zinc ribbon domain-containing protein [Methylomirabilota bacterium]|nr:zinc ribbon domain-containing protein [Methylomirabilota bacterium]
MPTYEYQCDQCHRTFEIRQRITAAPLTRCEACGGPLRRLLSAAPFILKGKGWYVTDYPSEARKKALETEKSADKTDKADKKDATSAEKSSTSASKETPTPSKETPTTSGSAAASSSPPASSG